MNYLAGGIVLFKGGFVKGKNNLSKSNIKYLLLKDNKIYNIIKKIRKDTNLTVGIHEIYKTINNCQSIFQKKGKLSGCIGADEGCKGYPKCFEVKTCLK